MLARVSLTSSRASLRRFMAMAPQDGLRNVAIVAHVDHGKTTLVDVLLQQSGALARASDDAGAGDGNAAADVATSAEDRVMDSNALERERGITILSKVTSMRWNNTHINLVDTPGHGDFGGEVERVLSMVDGIVLVVDAGEGPMAQTKFVLGKALSHGLRPVVVLNKMDRGRDRATEVEGEVFDLMAALEAEESQLDYRTLYASARQGWVVSSMEDVERIVSGNTGVGVVEPNARALLDALVEAVPAPMADPESPFSMLVTNLESDPYFGRVVTGRIHSGTVRVGDAIKGLAGGSGSARGGEDGVLETGRVVKLFRRQGLQRVEIEQGVAGDIVSLAGLAEPTVTDTVCSMECTESLPSRPIDPPVLNMVFAPNTSPLGGKEGKHVTSTALKSRLRREVEWNVSLSVEDLGGESMLVRSRGEMQLAVLIETMRREGYEFSVSPPEVEFRPDPDHPKDKRKKQEPIEEVVIDVDPEYSGTVIELMAQRKANMLDMRDVADKSRMRFTCPSRGLIGLRSLLVAATRGTAAMSHLFTGYEPFRGQMDQIRKGVLVSTEQGTASSFALQTLEARGSMFIAPGTEVYQGMIIGEHSRDTDLDINPVKKKAITNVRSEGRDETVRLKPPREMSIEAGVAYIQEGELVEITPTAVRLRKRQLDADKRQSERRRAKKAAE